MGWLRDLIEIVDASHDAEELLEHTQLAIYQDRIFAFTPKGALFQLPKGATAVDFAFAVHTDLGAQTVGAKINGRHMPLRTQLDNGDVVEIIKGKEAEPQLSWLGFVVTGKARAAIRRAVRLKERAEVAEIGAKLFDEIAIRVPAKIGKKAHPRRASNGWTWRRGRPDVRDRRGQADRPRGDGSAGARQHRGHGRGRRRMAAAGNGDLDPGLTPGVGFTSPNAATRCRATASSACAAKARGSRSTPSTASQLASGHRCRLARPVMGRAFARAPSAGCA